MLKTFRLRALVGLEQKPLLPIEEHSLGEDVSKIVKDQPRMPSKLTRVIAKAQAA